MFLNIGVVVFLFFKFLLFLFFVVDFILGVNIIIEYFFLFILKNLINYLCVFLLFFVVDFVLLFIFRFDEYVFILVFFLIICFNEFCINFVVVLL